MFPIREPAWNKDYCRTTTGEIEGERGGEKGGKGKKEKLLLTVVIITIRRLNVLYILFY